MKKIFCVRRGMSLDEDYKYISRTKNKKNGTPSRQGGNNTSWFALEL